jgi:hypothetical protein
MPEKGLNQELTDLVKGADIKKCLLSPNTMEYLTALQKLFTLHSRAIIARPRHKVSAG